MGKIATVLFLLLAVILVACSGETETVDETTSPEPTATIKPATNTSVPPTNTAVVVKEPITCDGVEDPCVEVTFDGENCIVGEPTENEAGWYVFAFTNVSEGVAKIEAMTLAEGKTLEHLAEDAANRPTGHHPYWVSLAGMFDKSVAVGDSVKLRGYLEAGINGVMCFRVPHYAVYGDGFTIVDTASGPTSVPRPTPSSQIEVTWDGNECKIIGPPEVPVGYYEFLWRDQTDDSFAFAVRHLDKAYSYQDLLDTQGEPGTWISKPSWVEILDEKYRWDDSIDAGIFTYPLDQAGSYPVVIWGPDLLWFCGEVTAVE